MKKILVLGTGGTIVSQPGQAGLALAGGSGALKAELARMGQYYDISHEDILDLDSSNIQAEEWQLIAEAVHRNRDGYHGIVITHGTDTMAYTASILTFMLQNIPIPVVLTGSQLPLAHPFSDGPANLAFALAAAAEDIPGVSVAFHHKLIKGCRAVKVRTVDFNAFESVNYPLLGQYSSAGFQKNSVCEKAYGGEYRYLPNLSNDVFLLKLIPGTHPDILDVLLECKYKGIVLEAFGIGGFHFMRRNLADKLRKLIQSGISVVIRSQCLYEQSDLSIYEVGQKALEVGAIQGWDMTAEACITKLMWALGQTDDPEGIREIFNTDYAGEVSLGAPG